jgi:hypothetical protein
MLKLILFLKFFKRISDGFFVPELFSHDFPYIEYNGEKIMGTLDFIIGKISGGNEQENAIGHQTNAVAVQENGVIADIKQLEM